MKASMHKAMINHKRNPSSTLEERSIAKRNFALARSTLRKFIRQQNFQLNTNQEEAVFNVCTSNPSMGFAILRKMNSTKTSSINELYVGNQRYQGNDVAHGFFFNIQNLKTCDEDLRNCVHCESYKFDYDLNFYHC